MSELGKLEFGIKLILKRSARVVPCVGVLRYALVVVGGGGIRNHVGVEFV